MQTFSYPILVYLVVGQGGGGGGVDGERKCWLQLSHAADFRTHK